MRKIVAIVGSYRKGGIIDSAVDEILSGAQANGGRTEKIYLVDQQIESCRNCRVCTQEAGERRGLCVVQDDVDKILNTIDSADAIILGSPMNFGTVTAEMKKFMERLVCYVYWPWGIAAPKHRSELRTKQAVVVASSAAPEWVARFSSDIIKLLKQAARLLGAQRTQVLYIGLAAKEEQQEIGVRTRLKARRMGEQLARS